MICIVIGLSSCLFDLHVSVVTFRVCCTLLL